MHEVVMPKSRATVFGYYVLEPERFSVVAFDGEGRATSIEEKPAVPKSKYAVSGFYFYPAGVSEKCKKVKPSARGELEITTLNVVEAVDFVRMIEKSQGIKISAPKEIAYRHEWIDKEKLLEFAAKYGKSPYGMHLKAVTEGKVRG